MNGWVCREGKWRLVDEILEKGRVGEWMGIWRGERATGEWEYGDGKWRYVDGSVENINGCEWMGV